MAPSPLWANGLGPQDSSLADLPITSPQCVNTSCRAFEDGFTESEKLISLLSQLEYAKWTVYFYAFWIVLFTTIHLWHLVEDKFLRNPRLKATRQSPSWNQKLLASYRSFTYRRVSWRRGTTRLPSFGILAILALATIFLAVLPFVEHPYIRSRFRFGSPPISVRCAMTLAALTPLTVALAGKVNIITILTGICYSRLNVIHRFVSYAMFYLSSVHTIPHLVAPVKDGGWAMLARLYANKRRELSGTPLYAVMFGLTFFSIPWARKRCYELFAYTHIFLALCYIGFLYWHIKGECMSPNYVYTTIAVWIFSFLARTLHRNTVFRMSLASSKHLVGFPTILEHLPGQMTRVIVKVPKCLSWKPGQHVYLRMPQISVLGNHPFTIASIPSVDSEGTSQFDTHDLVFLIRAHTGFTNHLARRVAESSTTPPLASSSNSLASLMLASPLEKPEFPISIEMIEAQRRSRKKALDLRTLIDGPYGGYIRPLHRIYDSVICVAGGSGITAILPWLLTISNEMRFHSSSPIGCRTKLLRLIWMVRSEEWISWVQNEFSTVLDNVQRAGRGCTVHLDVYVTAPTAVARSNHQIDVRINTETLGDLFAKREAVLLAPDVEKETTLVEELKVCVSQKHEMIPGNTFTITTTTVTANTRSASLNTIIGRPVFKNLLPNMIEGSKCMVMGCGPEGMKVDLSNTVADLQQHVLRGEFQEVALHTETFGW